MKKQLFTLLLVLGLGISSKGVDPFCVKNHESVLLNDHKWHTLMYACGLNNDLDGNSFIPFFNRNKLDGWTDNWTTAKIKIRQDDNGIDYEFRDTNEDAVLKFYYWLMDAGYYNRDRKGNIQTPIFHEGNEYIGMFAGDRDYYDQTFVPYIDEDVNFLGIDVF